MIETLAKSQLQTQHKSSQQLFKSDVLTGLLSTTKYLQSKYLYDASGDEIFQQIMNAPEYYLTDCELDIFKNQCSQMLQSAAKFTTGFDLIELGAGDALKSTYLLHYLTDNNIDFTYYPIDISEHVIDLLEQQLVNKLPGLDIRGFKGDYFDMLSQATKQSSRPKFLLFLGSNIGNMPVAEAEQFCRKLRSYLSADDLVLMGFDLKKNPQVIWEAYNDKAGVTRAFNLNLLSRINKELDANFNLQQFEHFENYDPETGACKSYLISLKDQLVTIANQPVSFCENEHIFIEISQKYTIDQTRKMALQANFKPVIELYDSKKWFVDVVWQCS